MVTVTIDGRQVEVEDNSSILDAAKKANINIPTLCYHEDQAVKANCRICVVKVEGRAGLQTSCSTPVEEGMVVHTNTEEVINTRRQVLELILSRHPAKCLTCASNGHCDLQDVAAMLNMTCDSDYETDIRKAELDDSSPSIIRDMRKCIVCGRCIAACSEVQDIYVMGKENRGYDTMVVPPYGKKLADTACVNCGQCVQVCPTGAITIHDDTECFSNAKREGKHIIAQIAPSVRINLAEALGEDPGTVSTGRLVSAMKIIGFDKVFDSDFSADLTIMEEGTELISRIKNGGVFPMFTSCCPGWIKYLETYAPDLRPHLSTCKSPMEMFGPLIKTYFAEKDNLDPKDICSVAIMPCTAKKFECKRREMNASGERDVDFVLTVVELARMIQTAGIDFKNLEETEFDNPFGQGSGAGLIFGATGGVMEAALRTVYEVVTGEPLENIEFESVRGREGWKEAVVQIGDLEVKVAIVHELRNARKLIEKVRAGEADYHFVEVMACPGGCVGGGGNAKRTWKKVEKRLDSIYAEDRNLPIRKSHENPYIKQCYEEFLGEPNSELAHKLLHTHYVDRHDLLNF